MVVALLRYNHPFARLWAARVTSLLADSIAVVTLILYLTEEDGRATTVSALLLSAGLPYLLSPLAGALADRVGHRRLMLASEVGQGAAMAGVAFLPGLHVLFMLVLGRAVLTMIFQPAGRSMVPGLVEDSHLSTANGLMGAGGQASRVVGPAVAGLLYVPLGPAVILGLVAGLSLVAVWFIQGLPSDPRAPKRPSLKELLAETHAGLTYLRRTPPVLVIGAVLFGSVAFAAMDDVALSFLGRETLGVGERGVGLLYSAPALGLVCGGLAMGIVGLMLSPRSSFLGGVAVQAVGLLATAAAPSLGLAVAAQVLGGIGNALENASTDTLIQREVPARMLGRVFGNVYGSAYLASTVAYAVGGPLLDATSPRTVFIVAGTGVFLVAGVGAIATRHSRRSGGSTQR